MPIDLERVRPDFAVAVYPAVVLGDTWAARLIIGGAVLAGGIVSLSLDEARRRKRTPPSALRSTLAAS